MATTTTTDTPSKINIKISLTGGLELLFQKRRTFQVSVDADSRLCSLITLLADRECDSSRRDVFLQDGTVRPGILVLVNDADWELEGEGEYVLQDRDEILFVSTLHGG